MHKESSAASEGNGLLERTGELAALFTPRPLGPLLDVAEVVGGELAELVQGSNAA
jgi:hypothetical protein